MTLLSGWCIDEVLALDLDQPGAAARLHAKCNYEPCPCKGHGKAAPKKTTRRKTAKRKA